MALDTSSARFSSDFSCLPEEARELVKDFMKSLLNPPIPKKFRLEKLKGHSNPSIYTVHIARNHAYKLSFELLPGGIAKMRRAGTHREIDRAP